MEEDELKKVREVVQCVSEEVKVGHFAQHVHGEVVVHLSERPGEVELGYSSIDCPPDVFLGVFWMV